MILFNFININLEVLTLLLSSTHPKRDDSMLNMLLKNQELNTESYNIYAPPFSEIANLNSTHPKRDDSMLNINLWRTRSWILNHICPSIFWDCKLQKCDATANLKVPPNGFVMSIKPQVTSAQTLLLKFWMWSAIGSFALKEKMESFWPKKLSQLKFYPGFRIIGEYLSQIDSILRVKLSNLTLNIESFWHMWFPGSNFRNLGSNFSSARDYLF